MKKLLFTVVAVAAVSLVQAQATWNFDKSHSNFGFAISHMVISETEGEFKDFEGTVVAAKDDFSDAKVDLTIKAASIDTDDEGRDKHLRAPDFFDVEKYADITFVSKELKSMGKGKYKLTGDFTMHGVTKEESFDLKYNGTVTGPYGYTRAGFKLKGSIDRTKYGVVYNGTLESGGLLIGEDVEIVCNIELIKQK